MKKFSYKKNGIHSVRGSVLASCVLFIAALSVSAQEKRNLTPEDYKLWSSVQLNGLDPAGAWMSYKLIYSDLEVDTLFVGETKGTKRFAFPNASAGLFTNDFFTCRNKEGVVYMLIPSKSEQIEITGVTHYEVTSKWVVVHRMENGSAGIALYNRLGQQVHFLVNATKFAINEDETLLAFTEDTSTGEKLSYLSLNQPEKKHFISEGVTTNYHRLKWSNGGNELAFLASKGGKTDLMVFNRDLKKVSVLSSENPFFQRKSEIGAATLTFSKEGDRVFFQTKLQKAFLPLVDPVVEVWKTSDPALYPKKTRINDWKATAKTAMWVPTTGELRMLTDTVMPYGGPVGQGRYALVYNPLQYEPQSQPLADRDVYITDLATGEKQLLVAQVGGGDRHLSAAPGADYFAYFKDKDWYVYDAVRRRHINITKGSGLFWEKDAFSDQTHPYGVAGWTTDRASLLVYDEHDLWCFNLKKGTSRRLTHGLESGIVYRLVAEKSEQERIGGFKLPTGGQFNLKETLLLSAHATDFSKNGYFELRDHKELRAISFVPKNTKYLYRSRTNDTFIWTEEDFQNAARIMVRSGKNNPRILFQSNLQQKAIKWGRMEEVSYKSAGGTPLKGLLYYPAGYDAAKKYPLIVHVYEVQSAKRYVYWNPTRYNGMGFNVSNLTAKGYLVLLTDTIFETGATGLNALQCVHAAVDAVVALDVVAPAKIGIVGHSFGGYETDFIITKTNRFACAVSGAANTDLISAALALSREVGIPNFFKIENGQTRMNGSLATEKERYIDNSSVFFADQVTTPLLSWTGLADTQVEPTQTFEFYMALRRLGKMNVVLAYPHEAHELVGKHATADLTTKMEEWWDYYLKEGMQPKWMRQN